MKTEIFNKLSKTNQERFKMLVHTEVNSLSYEGVVAITPTSIIRAYDGKKFAINNANIKKVWNDMLFDEGY